MVQTLNPLRKLSFGPLLLQGYGGVGSVTSFDGKFQGLIIEQGAVVGLFASKCSVALFSS